MQRTLIIFLILAIFFGCSRTPEGSNTSTAPSTAGTSGEDNSNPTIDSLIYPTNNAQVYVFDDLMFNITASDDNNIKYLYVIIDNTTNTYNINSKTVNYKNYTILKNSMQGNNKTIKFLVEDSAGKKSEIKSVNISILSSSIDWDYKESFNEFLPTDIKVNYREGTYQNSLYNISWNYTQVRNDGGSNVNNVIPYYTNPDSISNPPLLPTPVIRNSNIAILISAPITEGISKLYFQYFQPFSSALNFNLKITREDTNITLFETNIVKTQDKWTLKEFGPINLNIDGNFRIIFTQNGGGQLAIDNIRWKKFDGSSSSTSSIQSSSSSIASSSQSSSSSESSSTISSSSSISSSSLSSLSSSISSTSSQVSSSSSISSAIGGNIVFFEDFALFNPTNISSTYLTGEFTNSTGIIWKYTHVRNDGGTTGSGATNYTNPNNIPNPPTLPTPVIRNSNITLLMSSEIDIPESGNYSIYFQYHQPFTTGLNFIFQLTASDTNTIIYQTNIAITNRAVLYEFGPIQLNITSPQQIRFVFRPKGGGQTAIDNITVKKE